MPSSISGLILLVVCAAPGFLYTAIRHTRHPESKPSALREATRIILASLALITASAAVLAAANLFIQLPFPHIGRWIEQPNTYLARNVTMITAWSVALLALALAVAAIAGRVVPAPKGPLHTGSAWWKLFKLDAELAGAKAIYVGCELVDGSYVAGVLQSFAYHDDPSIPREFTLGQPLSSRPNSSEPVRPVPLHSVALISAEQIKLLFVTYLDHIPGTDRGQAAQPEDR